jgi:hypothetical protein
LADALDEGLHMDLSKCTHVKLQPKITTREGASDPCKGGEYVVQVDLLASNWVDRAFF